jgi:hypothetical protein
MSGNSALFPKAPHAAVGTINAAIVAMAVDLAQQVLAHSRGRVQRFLTRI